MDEFTDLDTLVACLTRTLALASPEMAGHHVKVARLSRAMADVLDIPLDEKRALVIAALLHDIGAVASGDMLPLLPDEHAGIDAHAILSAELLSELPIPEEVISLIRYHHTPWNDTLRHLPQGRAVPEHAHIIHLAGGIASHIDERSCVLSQITPIKDYVVQQRGLLFSPEAVDAFLKVCDREALWLDLVYEPPAHPAVSGLGLDKIRLSLEEVGALTQVLPRIIDFRSPFTASHSAGVAAAAVKLAELAPLTETGCKMMNIAGNLHDIGKLAIPTEILEKQGELDPAEYEIIRSHTYHTYRVLHGLKGFEEIAQWAAFHHERVDGRGYPFHLGVRDLPLGSRIMAVADVFAAIAEDRPYRTGMGRDEIVATLKKMSEEGALSLYPCSLLIDNFEIVDEARREATADAADAFLVWRKASGLAV